VARRSVGTPATVALTRAGVPFTVHPYEHVQSRDAGSRTSYGLEAAEALGVDAARVFKTLLADVDGSLVVAVVPVSGQLDLKALAAAVGGKRAAMADPAVAERATGYVVGGISPLGQRTRLRTVVEESATDHPTIFVSAGRRGVDLELAPADLVAVLEAHTARIGRKDG
jgi:Cys-tRNA(Pro)/Cys-tRNA(Cys) deacylase